MCWLTGFWMLFSRSFFQMTVTSRAGAVIFSVQNYQLAGLVAPFWHPGSPLLHIGGALGGYRSSRKDILGSRVGFSLILCGFRDPILRAFLVLWSNTGDFFHVFYQVFFLWFSGMNLVVWSLENKDLVWEGVQKPTCHRYQDYVDFSVIFHVF